MEYTGTMACPLRVAAAALLVLAGCDSGDPEKRNFGQVRASLLTSPFIEDGEPIFYADALFYRVAPLGLPRSWSDGDCVRDTSTQASLDEDAMLDAGGDIPLDGPNGDFEIMEVDDGFYQSGGPATLWQSEGVYTFDVLGGEDVEAFTDTLQMPGLMTLTSPDPFAPSVAIDRNEDFEIAWVSSGSTAPVWVSLRQSNSNFETVYYLACYFEDDGAAKIRSSNFLGAKDGNAGLTISKSRETLVEREFGVVYISGAVDFWLQGEIGD
jgi:hypothetical protein